MRFCRTLAGIVLLPVLSGCIEQSAVTTKSSKKSGLLSDGATSPNSTAGGSITVSWNASHAKGVNAAGGGYRVYYSTTGTLTTSTPVKSIPFVSGALAPITTKLTGLSKGTYWLFVVAYSANNLAGSAATRATVVVP